MTAPEVPATNDPNEAEAARALIAAIADELTPGRRDKDLVLAARELRKRSVPEVLADDGTLAAVLMNHMHTPKGLCACGHTYSDAPSHSAVTEHVAEAIRSEWLAAELQKARAEEWLQDAQEVEALPEGSIVLAAWMHDKTERPYELVRYRLLRAVGAAHGKSPAQFAMPIRVLWRAGGAS